jgi:hypothetical protein
MAPKMEVSKQDILNLLRSKYCMRLNLHRKKIEHCSISDELCGEEGDAGEPNATSSKRFKNDEDSVQVSCMITTEEEEKLLCLESAEKFKED